MIDAVLVLELVAVQLLFCGLSYWIGRRSTRTAGSGVVDDHSPARPEIP